MTTTNTDTPAVELTREWVEWLIASRGASPDEFNCKLIAMARSWLARQDEMERLKLPEWAAIGRMVEWRGQRGMCVEQVLRVTEPQPGNFVLWTTLDGGDDENEFPINIKQVKPHDAALSKEPK